MGEDGLKEMAMFTAVATVEIASVGINTLYKASTSKGLTYFVFIAYSYLIGALSLTPLPFIFPRREVVSQPFLKLSTSCLIVLSAISGIISSVLSLKGIEYSSPTLASAVGNLTPAFTFIFGVIFRLEKLKLRSSTTQIKILGTIFSISGALVAILYNGPAVFSVDSSYDPSLSSSLSSDWIIGGIMLGVTSLFNSIWYILQGEVMRRYPDESVVSLAYFLCKTIIAVPICLAAEANSGAWKLRPDISLVAIVFGGLFGPSFAVFMLSWVIHLKGPLYTVIFKPLSVAIAAFLGYIFLRETLFLGSVVGAIIILVGFYAVIWAKSQESQEIKNRNSDTSDEVKTHLLQ